MNNEVILFPFKHDTASNYFYSYIAVEISDSKQLWERKLFC